MKENIFVSQTTRNFKAECHILFGISCLPVCKISSPTYLKLNSDDVITCTPTTPTTTTFLFAYSNDFDSQTVLGVWNYLANSYISPHFSAFANIRFDVRNEDDIQYHNDWRDVSESIQSHLPEPSLGFGNSNTGSDVLKMIEKFLDNRQAPVCASKLLILVKRYPNETEVDRLIGKMRQYHASLTFIYSVAPSGGHHSETLYHLATKTNGFCAFDQNDNSISTVEYVPSLYNPYLIYAANPQISGQGNINLATMRVPLQNRYWFVMTVQDQMPIDAAETVNLTWSKVGSTESDFLGVSGGKSLNGYYFGNHLTHWEPLDQASYSMSLNYKYSDNNLKTLQIRVYSRDPINYWIPYDN